MPFPLLARHIFAGSLQSGTGSLHPFLCGFEPGFRGLGRLPRRQSANLHRVRLRLHDGHAPVVSDGHPALADDSLLPVAAGNGHDMSAGFAPASIPALSAGTVELPLTLTSDIFPEPRTTTLTEPSSASTE